MSSLLQSRGSSGSQESGESAAGGLASASVQALQRLVEPEQVANANAVVDSLSELLKKATNDPMTGLYQVQQHIREKGLREQVLLKDKLLAQLTRMRHSTATASATSAAAPSAAAGAPVPVLKEAAAAMTRVATKVDVLRQRLAIVSGIQEEVMSPRKSKRLSFGRRRTGSGSAAESLPIGIGQLLDNDLLTGDLDIDSYALETAKLAKAYEKMTHEQ